MRHLKLIRWALALLLVVPLGLANLPQVYAAQPDTVLPCYEVTLFYDSAMGTVSGFPASNCGPTAPVSPTAGGITHSFTSGTAFTLTATAYPNYQFDGFDTAAKIIGATAACSGTSSFKISGNFDIDANFSSSPGSCVPVTPTATELGGKLKLTLFNAPTTAWVGVQWQGGDGIWHDVESWFGTYNEEGYGWSTRWVLSKDYGLPGPFRWVIYDKQGGTLWGTSSSFAFPATATETVWRTVSK